LAPEYRGHKERKAKSDGCIEKGKKFLNMRSKISRDLESWQGDDRRQEDKPHEFVPTGLKRWDRYSQEGRRLHCFYQKHPPHEGTKRKFLVGYNSGKKKKNLLITMDRGY